MEKSKDYESLVAMLKFMLKNSTKDAKFEFLKCACLSREINICQACIDAKFNLNMCNTRYGTPLLIELSGDIRFDVNMAKFLVNNGARIEKKKNCSFESPLTAACCCGNLELIKYLIDEGCVITRRGYDTDLGVAIRNGQTEVVKLLLSLGVVSVNDEQYLDSLLIKDEKNLDMVELLLKSGANPNEDEILTKAVECENYKMVELLLKFGADPNKYSGISPLHVAVCCDNFRLAKLLLENNADVNARMKDYSKIMKYDGALVAMDIAVFRKNKNMYDLLNKYGGSTTTRLEQLEGLNSIYKEST